MSDVSSLKESTNRKRRETLIQRLQGEQVKEESTADRGSGKRLPLKQRALSISTSRPIEDFARKLRVDDLNELWLEVSKDPSTSNSRVAQRINQHRTFVQKVMDRSRFDKKQTTTKKRPALPKDKVVVVERMKEEEKKAKNTPEAHRQRAEAMAKLLASHRKRSTVSDKRALEEVPAPATHLITLEELYGLEGDDETGAKKKAAKGDDDENEKPDWQMLLSHMKQEGRLSPLAAEVLILDCSDLLCEEKNLIQINVQDGRDCIVFGDIHGQYFDLLNLLATINVDCSTDTSVKNLGKTLLFLGDFVDRGCFGCEVLLLLCALKVNYPTEVYFLRGNHESRILTSNYNFKEEVIAKYNDDIYERFVDFFNCLPLAATVTNSVGRFFCTHGGLSPAIEKLEEIDEIERFGEVPKNGPMCDLLWADPLGDWTAEELDADDMLEWYDVGYEANPDRGCSYVFGWKAVEQFLEMNNVVSIIRAHEVQKEGFLKHTFHRSNREHPPVITVFSAPDYCGMYNNRGAFLVFSVDSYDLRQVDSVPHPYWLPRFKDAIGFTFPYVVDAIAQVFGDILSLPNTVETDEAKQKYINRLKAVNDMKSSTEKEVQQIDEIKSEAYTLIKQFEEAFNSDFTVEHVHPSTRFRSKSY